jgi:cyclic beta-1,2-glucan synthetase
LTAAEKNAPRGDPRAKDLPDEVRALAEEHRNVRRAGRSVGSLFELSPVPRALERARRRLGSKAGEWFLDNYYFVRRVARQVADELPRGFLRRLPQLASGPHEGMRRVDALARALLARGIELDANALGRFIETYQGVSALTIAELWALPTMLRAAALQELLDSLDDARPKPGMVPNGVERSIRALRFFSEVDWRAFFERSSRVDAILRKDPADVYERMDFDTCDSYRKTVEDLAWSTGELESRVAELAVGLADQSRRDDPGHHVGYFLVGAGRRVLEERLGFRPRGVERIRRGMRQHPSFTYLGSLALSTALPLLLEGFLLSRECTQPVAIVSALAVSIIPASAAGAALVHWLFARVLRPRTLPKLDFSKGLPDDVLTLIVIPVLLGRSEDVAQMIRQIELHHLANPDPKLQFALLTDYADSTVQPQEDALLDSVVRGIESLNAKYGGTQLGPFHLLHRAPKWNSSERRFMGWERKRGKLLELNRLLRGDRHTSYALHVGNPTTIEGIRFVITLDSDTQLPMGSAHRLIGLFAHPLNRPVFDEQGRIVSGYTIVQPRVETSPSGVRVTRFSRIFSGDVGYDIYTHACSDLYQDLFGAGIYVGKGIYDVDAFMRSVEGKAPENALASHDLFEGVHGRAALATDIVFFESYPSRYAIHARRQHRWVRGDWQLLPWLLPRVPTAEGSWEPNPLSLIDRWKIVDNLRRSLVAPTFVLLLVFGWTWMRGSSLLWTLGTLGLFLAPAAPMLAGDGRHRAEALRRWALSVAFLVHEASVNVDAIIRVCVRLVTRRNLLQWTCVAHAERRLGGRSARALLWMDMLSSPLVAVAVSVLIWTIRRSSFFGAAPLLGLWLAAPEIALWVSQPVESSDTSLPHEARRKLRRLARRTWLFFETFVGPHDQWLPIDNHQEQPYQQTAHRTSPTNIGMLLLSSLSAYDLGYIGPSELALRLRRTFDTISRLEHYRGHLLNWYDTRSLEPLLPRYVSTVDSGNFAGCLLAVKQGCTTIEHQPLLRSSDWDGLGDLVDLLEEVLDSLSPTSIRSVQGVMAQMRRAIASGRDSVDNAYAVVRELGDELSKDLDRALFALIEAGAFRSEAGKLKNLRLAIEGFHRQLQQMRREVDQLVPWLALKDDAKVCGIELPENPRLGNVAESAQSVKTLLDRWEQERRLVGPIPPTLEASARRLRQAAEDGSNRARALCDELVAIADRADQEHRAIDFRLLFDGERKLFRIGYNATVDRVDPNYYDLLASEARLASYIAIVKGDLPLSHWYALGRPMARTPGGLALLSWGGTMFEYLMPSLLMRSQPGTLLAETCAHIVSAQIAFGEKCKMPWGISEAAFGRLDAHDTYQYRSFGIPGLGFKRGLEDDRVVTPYASALALCVRPRAVVENLERLEDMGMFGSYGMFEAVDFRSEDHLEDERFVVVRSYMAHHQGMVLVAINNALNDAIMVDRFHSDAVVETGAFLLNEHSPVTVPREWPHDQSSEPSAQAASLPSGGTPRPWSLTEDSHAQAFVISNGSFTSLLTAGGGGGSLWRGIALTRYQPDPSRAGCGLWLYLRDEESGRLWRATTTGGRTTYAVHKAEFHRRIEGISIHVDVTVAPADDVELRQVTIRNETNRHRRLSVTSAGEPALVPTREAAVHPAFSKMFIESDWDAGFDALVFSRRQRDHDEPHVVLVHRLVGDGPGVHFAGYETDRAAFYGRGATEDLPVALAVDQGPLRGSVGAVIDPIMSIMATVDLKPNGIATLAFVTAAAPSRSAALDLAGKYASMHTVRWAFGDAAQSGRRRLQKAQLDAELLPSVQRLFSALLFADRAHRAPSSVIATGRPCKRKLWSRGISGDDPILLVRVSDADAPLVRETVAAQRYLRACGVRLDLVFVDHKASGYADGGAGSLRATLGGLGVDEWLNRHGGIYVLVADQLSREDTLLLEASARVVLDTRDGSLVQHFIKRVTGTPELPRLNPTRAADPSPRASVPSKRVFDNGQGGFTEDGREYVILVRPGRPTPAPWCNVMANPEFGTLVSESSFGCTWSLNSGENRLTEWRNDPVLDTPSEVLYLRDEESAAVWSPTPLPAGREAETMVCHGAGYTTYTKESHGLRQEVTVFVAHDSPVKVVRLRLENVLDRHRRLTATYYAEWVLGSRREEQRAYVTSEIDHEAACILASCAWNAEFGERVAFLASKDPAHGFTTDRYEFLGQRGDYATPEGLERWGLSGRTDAGVDPCAALQVHLELPPGARIETHFVLGQAANRAEALKLVARFRSRAAVEAAWTGMSELWDDVLGKVRVKTPEPAMDLLLNRWLLYQTLSSRFFGRTGFYQSSGAFGFRDQLQDVLALLHSAPELARSHILCAAAHQFEEGDVLHWWHPPEDRGVRTRCSDDLVWLPFVTSEYVQATGDRSILSERVPFLTGSPLRTDEHDRYAKFESGGTPASLLEHCRRALERASTAGAHGLPLMGTGDWNDGMNRVGAEGRGESVWLGWFLASTMRRFASLCDFVDDGPQADRWRGLGRSLLAAIERCAWDGQWYVRAFHDDGSVVGSARNAECRIDSIAQSWAALSGGVHDARTRIAVASADEELVREAERLVLLLDPPFDGTRHDPGYIRAYPPGVRENGGQYTHAATWLGCAHAALGDGERAEHVFRLLNPILRTHTAMETERYRLEPYVLAGDVYSVSPHVGRGGWSWYTGSAAWMWRLGVESILGLRSVRGELCIDPHIPPSWRGFEAWLRIGSREVHVVVENPDAAGNGVAAMTLDGITLDPARHRVDMSKSNGESSIEVRVRLGSPQSSTSEPRGSRPQGPSP